jgi:hypothetical protein
VLHPDSIRKPTGHESGSTPVLVTLTIASSHPRRQVTMGEPLLIEARRATALVTGREGAWVESGDKRQALETGSEVRLDSGSPVRIGSARSFGTIELRPEYVVVPLTIELPRMPEWLQQTVDGLARTSRILIDAAAVKTPTGLVVAADELERVLHLLDARLTGPAEEEKPTDARVVQVGTRPRSDMEAVKRAVHLLKSLIRRAHVTGFVLPEQARAR